eukprot:177505-Pelagomonas_calceolata.AAC.1
MHEAQAACHVTQLSHMAQAITISLAGVGSRTKISQPCTQFLAFSSSMLSPHDTPTPLRTPLRNRLSSGRPWRRGSKERCDACHASLCKQNLIPGNALMRERHEDHSN